MLNVVSIGAIEEQSLFCFLKGGTLACINTNNWQVQWALELDSQSLLLEDKDFLYPYKRYFKIFRVSKSNGSIISNNEIDFYPIVYSNNRIYGILHEEKEGDILSTLNPADFSRDLFFPVRGDIKYLDSKHLITQHSGELICREMSHGRDTWRVNLINFTEIKDAEIVSEVLLIEGRIIFAVSDGMVVCLDVENGKVIWKTDFQKGWLVTYNKQIYGLHGTTIGILSPQNGSYQVLDLSHALQPHGLSFSWNQFVLQGKELYFVDNGRPRAGVVDLETKELIWFTEITLEENTFHIQQIKVLNSRFYVLTQGGTLYVFER